MFARHLRDHHTKLWAALAGLARQSPRLKPLYTRGADPRVARLVQATALGAAVASARLDDDGQLIARPLVAGAMPECLRPRPASTIVQFDPTRSMPQQTRELVIPTKVDGIDVHFEVRWPVHVGPYQLAEARIVRVDSEHQVLHLAITSMVGADLVTRLPDRLRLFFNVAPDLAVDILHALRSSREPVTAVAFDADGELLTEMALPPTVFQWVRLDTTEPPIVGGPRDRFESGTLLRDYFDAEETFAFADFNVSAVRPRAASMTRLELTFPLGRLVEGASRVARDNVLLFCSPATNQYRARTVPIQAGPHDTEWVLSVARRPHAEILHLESLYVDPYDGGPRQPLIAWEAADDAEAAETFGPYYLLAQSKAASEPRTLMLVTFADDNGFFCAAPAGIVRGDVLASDGALTASLKMGDIQVRELGIANVTRVTSSRRAVIGKELSTRLAAYARQGAHQFANHVALAEFLSLHDGYALADVEGGSKLHVPDFVRVSHEHVHERAGTTARFGDRFLATVRAGACRPGEIWAIGECMARAFAERTERLRFSELVLRTDSGGNVTPPFSRRAGICLPFPFG
ncbi:type VI secretion system baseplate subunit TssF [Pendulispora rubella]|uniref:Type VI secretion system baseplate subunit TssF n=1 Tax=Pendulispora rubella TaxID=2741070 RepID=A0ABZ2KU93_9BACT